MSKKKIEVQNATVRMIMPEGLSEMTVEDYQRWLQVIDTNKEDDNIAFLRQKVIEIFCKVPLDVVFKMSNNDVQDISNQLFAMLMEDESDVIKTFEYKGIKFGLINDFENMTFGEFTDASEYIKDSGDLHNLLAVMYRPITEEKMNPLLKINQYEIEPYEGTSRYALEFKKLPATIARRASFFLFNSMLKLQRDMLGSLEEQAKHNPQMKQFLTKSTVGSTPFTDLLDTISSGSKQSPVKT